MTGKSEAEVKAEFEAAGKTKEEIKNLHLSKCSRVTGQPTHFVKQITPSTLGSLIALYEHKIFVQV